MRKIRHIKAFENRLMAMWKKGIPEKTLQSQDFAEKLTAYLIVKAKPFRKMTGCWSASDLAQECALMLLPLFRKPPENFESPKGYLLRTMRNLAYRIGNRELAFRRILSSPEYAPFIRAGKSEESYDEEERAAEISLFAEFMGRLPEFMDTDECKLIIHMRSDMTEAQIAEAFGLKAKTASSRITRMRKRLPGLFDRFMNESKSALP